MTLYHTKHPIPFICMSHCSKTKTLGHCYVVKLQELLRNGRFFNVLFEFFRDLLIHHSISFIVLLCSFNFYSVQKISILHVIKFVFIQEVFPEFAVTFNPFSLYDFIPNSRFQILLIPLFNSILILHLTNE